jgi:V-type H+-transporting ATPase subunit G
MNVEKAERLRQAKDEAAKEVLMYKQEKDEEFAKSVESDAVSGKSTAEALARDAEEQIAGATRNVSVNKNRVLDLLLSDVKTV